MAYGKGKYNMNKMSNVSEILKHNPNLECSTLRPILMACTTKHASTGTHIFADFCQRIYLYILRNYDWETDITLQDTVSIMPRRQVTM